MIEQELRFNKIDLIRFLTLIKGCIDLMIDSELITLLRNAKYTLDSSPVVA